MINPFTPIMEDLSQVGSYKRGVLIESHIADLHFGAIDPAKQYRILEEQYLLTINSLPKLDIISVDGDIFDHKVMSNSDKTYYASLFIDNLIRIARNKNATVIILHGTYSHDADQLKLFYHYVNDPTVDVRIVTTIQYVYAKGATILCIPELYGVDEDVYRQFLFGSYYDECFMHGTFHGAVYGDQTTSRLFHIEDFNHCYGPILAGHVHKPGCFDGYFYYCGTPIRYKFGEEEEKGHLIVMHDLDTHQHTVQFLPIKSFLYTTIDIDDIISNDPRVVIDYITNLKNERGIDYIKIRFNSAVDGTNKSVLMNHFRNNPYINVEFLNKEQEKQKELEEQIYKDKEYGFVTDPKLTPEQKFCMYVNKKEGCEFITVEKLQQILSNDVF